ncbi:MAG: RidA family protein [Bryobacteraceae bacterium]
MRTSHAWIGLAACLTLGSLDAGAQAVQSRALKIGDTVYLSAAGGGRPGASMEQAVRQVLLELESPLREHGLTLADIVSTDVWVTGLDKATEVRKAFQSAFKRRPPAGTLTEVSALPGGAIVQVAAVAAKGDKRVIRPQGTRHRNPLFSPAVQAGDALYLSGQTGIDPGSGNLIAGDIKAHVGQSLKNIGSILAAAGLDFSNVVQANVILTNPSDFGPMGDVYRTFTSPPRPARVPLGATRLDLGAPVEITMRARKTKGRAILPAGMEPSDNYSRGFLAGPELYVAGIGSAKESVEEGTLDSLERVKKIVEAAGLSMGDLVEARVYLSDIGNLDAMERGYRKYFGGAKPPTRAVVAVANLPAKLKIMTSFVAARP